MTPETRLVRVWKRVENIVFLIAFVAGIWFFYVFYDYQATLPRHPDQVAGRVYPLNEHFITVYQTRDQHDRLDGIGYTAVGMFVAMFVLKAIRVNTFGRGTKP
jgi:hypothetical protein